MTAEAVGSLSRGSLGEALRDQFDTWRFEKARARQIARIRTEARRIARADSLVDVYEQEISAVHDEVDSFVLPIETAIEDARIKTPEIKEYSEKPAEMIIPPKISASTKTKLEKDLTNITKKRNQIIT